MRRDRAVRRGRWLWLLLAGLVGFLLGDWHATASRPAGVSAAQNVALRFPEPQADIAVADPAAADGSADAAEAQPMVLGRPELALLSPEPMVPAPPPPAAVLPAAQATSEPPTAAAPPPSRAETRGAAVHRANRPGVVLNDAQIASIKARLHLTPDQEQMWPAVAAALRNVAYARARDAHRRSGSAAQLASADPASVEVQGLKSAAIPLIMSFSDQQKSEVRSLARAMGLDNLATEF